MVKNFIQNVEILCKNLWKSSCKFRVIFRVKLLANYFPVYKLFYTPSFPTNSTYFFTSKLQRSLTIFSTIPHPLLLQLHNIFSN